MSKRASKGKRRSKVAPLLGIAGVSLAMAGGGASASAVGSVADMPSHNPTPRGVITLGEEEISDVSLSTFFVFDKESAGAARLVKAAVEGRHAVQRADRVVRQH